MEEVVLKVKVEGSGDSEAKIKTVKQQLREAKKQPCKLRRERKNIFKPLTKPQG